MADYSYQSHMDWLRDWMEALDLARMTLVCQDWGSLLGLRLAAEHAGRFDRIVVANGFLPTGDRGANAAFRIWRAFATFSPWFPIGRIVNSGVVDKLSAAEVAAYDAPFPDSSYKAGARAFPRLVPTTRDDPAAPANRAAWQKLGEWRKPFLCLFGRNDPILGRADQREVDVVMRPAQVEVGIDEEREPHERDRRFDRGHVPLFDRGRDSTLCGVAESIGHRRGVEAEALMLRLLRELASRVVGQRRVAACQRDEVGLEPPRGCHLDRQPELGRQGIARHRERLEDVARIGHQPFEHHIEAV